VCLVPAHSAGFQQGRATYGAAKTDDGILNPPPPGSSRGTQMNWHGGIAQIEAWAHYRLLPEAFSVLMEMSGSQCSLGRDASKEQAV